MILKFFIHELKIRHQINYVKIEYHLFLAMM